ADSHTHRMVVIALADGVTHPVQPTDNLLPFLGATLPVITFAVEIAGMVRFVFDIPHENTGIVLEAIDDGRQMREMFVLALAAGLRETRLPVEQRHDAANSASA